MAEQPIPDPSMLTPDRANGPVVSGAALTVLHETLSDLGARVAAHIEQYTQDSAGAAEVLRAAKTICDTETSAPAAVVTHVVGQAVLHGPLEDGSWVVHYSDKSTNDIKTWRLPPRLAEDTQGKASAPGDAPAPAPTPEPAPKPLE